jgi:FtsZ-interacting cell division protein ZipA
MSTPLIVAIVIVVVAIVLIAVWFTNRQRRTRELRDRFGPEYDRAVDQYGGAEKANEALAARAERVEQLNIRPLAPDQSARYAESWRAVQARFVDDPEHAIDEADALVADVMQTRGYPMGDFEQRAADISVDHPRVVEHYRAAHAIAQQTARGDASTEDMRQAMVHFRTLFQELIDTRETAHVEAH